MKGQIERAFVAAVKGLPEYVANFRPDGGDPVFPDGKIYLPVYAGADHQEIDAPCVICECAELEEKPRGSGNYFAAVTVTAMSDSDREHPFDDMVAAHNRIASDTVNALWRDDLADLLNADAELFVYAPITNSGQSSGVEGRMFYQSISFRIYCCASKIT